MRLLSRFAPLFVLAVLGAVATLALLQTVSGLVVTDVVPTCFDRIGQIEVWPGAVFLLFDASTRRHRRGALVAWVAVVPALVAGFALCGEPLGAVAPGCR